MYAHVAATRLNLLDVSHHSAILFITQDNYRAYYCELYKKVHQHLEHISIHCVFIYTAMLSKLQRYLTSLVKVRANNHLTTGMKCNTARS